MKGVPAGVLAGWRARAEVARNGARRAWGRQALRITCLAAVGLALAAGTFVLFERAFRYLQGLEVVGPLLVARLLGLFLFMLFVMLTMSNVIVAFQALYRSREAEFWMLAPLPPESLLDARSPEVAFVASWAFLALGTPLLLAHGIARDAHPAHHALLPVVMVAFGAVAHFLGVLVVMALVRLLPGLDMKRLVALVVVALLPVAATVVSAFRVADVGAEEDVAELVVRALEGLGRTQYPFLPGYWAAEALHAAATGLPGRAAFFTWALAITALLLGLLAREAAAAWLVPGYQRLRGGGRDGISAPTRRPARRRRRAGPPGGPRRALCGKDLRLFVRDPAQWSQAGLVALLGVVYVVNLRNMPDLSGFGPWSAVAGWLNVAVVLLLMATLCTRFAFPLLSMEGRRAWIVMLAPLPRAALLWQKVAVALPLTFGFGQLATLLSCGALGVDPGMQARTHVVVALGAVALSGLAVGLGALFPDFREDSPARIVSGFGGTLCFIVALAYVMAVTLLLGAPAVLGPLGRLGAMSTAAAETAALALAAALSLAVAGLPLAAGRRRLERLEL